MCKIIKSIFKNAKKFRRSILFDIWSFSDMPNSKNQFKVIFIGQNIMEKSYLGNLIFNNCFQEKYLGRITIFSLPFYFYNLKKKSDLLILKSNKKICNFLSSRNDYLIPDWISCEIDLGCDHETACMSKRSFKSNLKNIKQGNFSYTITHDINDFNFFYSEMYLPYMYKRHGETAFILSYDEMKKGFDNGELLQVKENQKTVAGVIIDYRLRDGCPRMFKSGVFEGDFEYVKRGAFQALYYYTIQYLKEANYQKVNLGLSRPFFSDGVLQHKLNWGAKIVCQSTATFLFAIISSNANIIRFLSSHPFILQEKCYLTLVYFFDRGGVNIVNIDKEKNKLLAFGINKVVSHSL